MDIIVQGRNTEVTPNLLEYIERKIGRLARHLPTAREALVELQLINSRSAKDRAVVQVTLDCNGTLLRGEDRAQDFMTAVDSVSAVLDRQAKKYKEKVYRSFSRLPEEGVPEEELVVEIPGEMRQVLRVKRFPMKPMALEEAVEQMELLGHDFFLFPNEDTGQISLLYRRRDGHYGLIEAQFP